MSSADFENPELIDEYIQSLQDQADALRDHNERLADRISLLKQQRAELGAKLSKRKRRHSEATPAPRPDRSIDIPGVGHITDLELPSGPVSRSDLRVAIILDEFSCATFQYEFNNIEVSARTWAEDLETDPPDLLLVESAYRGDGSWGGRIARFGRPSPQLEQLVGWCRDRRIPTVFWNKEDPINFDWFIASAGLFDWVFTVDSNKLDTYRKRLGHSRVGVLQFAAQPVIHHPGNDSARTGGVAFAGSYYAAKHPQRREQMEMLLEPAIDMDIDIFDRMDRQDDPRFSWPEDYKARIVGSLTYPQTLEIYRRYQVFVNINTVTGSPTMCARRIYEILASGAQVVSGPSAALDGVPVLIAHSEGEARSLLDKALELGPNVEGQRWIASGNTMSDRVDDLLRAVLG